MKKHLLIFTILLYCSIATAQIKMIVPFASGGAVDQMARNFARYIEVNAGEEVIVENVTGAGSIVGTQRLLSSNPNKTLMFTNSSYFVNIVKGSFKENEFAVVSMIGETPYILIGSRTRNLTCNDLKNNKRNFFIGTSGKDSASSSAAELIINKNKNFIEVPYRGVSPALVDLIGDRIDITFSIGTAHVRNDTVAIANTSNKKFENINSWKECLGVQEKFIVEYLIVSNSSATLDFLNKINKLAFIFPKDQRGLGIFKENGVTDTTSNLNDTTAQAKESLVEWKKLYREKYVSSGNKRSP
jgi:tripartite-type tricarboxylate transporter receptor subunit TctC